MVEDLIVSVNEAINALPRLVKVGRDKEYVLRNDRFREIGEGVGRSEGDDPFASLDGGGGVAAKKSGGEI